MALADTDINRYAKYCLLLEERVDQGNLERIQYCVQKGLPTGSKQFKSQIEDALERRLGSGRRGRPRLKTKKGL